VKAEKQNEEIMEIKTRDTNFLLHSKEKKKEKKLNWVPTFLLSTGNSIARKE
jgi:hypothetical protein